MRWILSFLALTLAAVSFAQTVYTTTQSGIFTARAADNPVVSVANGGQTFTIGNKEYSVESIDSILFQVPDIRYVGGDISLLAQYEAKGAQYFDNSGAPIADMLSFFSREGWNAMRVRLFVDPSNASEADRKGGVVQDLDYVIALAKRIKAAGFLFLLDFHYSDSWADPGKQTLPAAWSGLTTEQLNQKVYEYTTESLKKLNEAGATPDFIQPGNEITYGMLWPTGHIWPGGGGQDGGTWENFTGYLKNAVKACREQCPQAKVVVHTELSTMANAANFYTNLASYDVDYDIIGLSYYPAYHGQLTAFDTTLGTLESKFPGKDIWVVETGYSFEWALPDTKYTLSYGYSEEGQEAFAVDLIATLKKHSAVKGLFWWWPEANEFGIDWTNSVTSGWWNASLFDSRNGKAFKALSRLQDFK